MKPSKFSTRREFFMSLQKRQHENEKINYDALMEQEITKFSTKKSILLHSCCGPCSTAVIQRLKDYFHITILYYNPNIEPLEEYEKRKKEQIRFLSEFEESIQILDIDYDHESFQKISKGLESEPEGGARCHKCYYLRLEKTLEIASLHRFDYFGTTLTVSPHKNAKVINEMGLLLEKKYFEQNQEKPILFLVSDFKKRDGYKKSIELSKQYNLYRQEYCGCLYGKE